MPIAFTFNAKQRLVSSPTATTVGLQLLIPYSTLFIAHNAAIVRSVMFVHVSRMARQGFFCASKRGAPACCSAQTCYHVTRLVSRPFLKNIIQIFSHASSQSNRAPKYQPIQTPIYLKKSIFYPSSPPPKRERTFERIFGDIVYAAIFQRFLINLLNN